MIQFNGYFGCTHCEIEREYLLKRMIYDIEETAPLRSRVSFKECGEAAEKNQSRERGVARVSPLSNFLPSPPGALIDQMHQFFLGATKNLVRAIVSVLTREDRCTLDKMLNHVNEPLECLHTPEPLAELGFLKAADFKILLFHLGLMMLRHLKSLNSD